MATILAHITIKAGEAAHFEALAREMYSATHQHETAVRHYEYWRGEQPNTYYALLAFDDFHGFIAHQTSPHHEAASGDLRSVIEAMRLEWVDPIAGASPLPPTAHQAPAEGASDLEVRYSSMFAAHVAEWWATQR